MTDAVQAPGLLGPLGTASPPMAEREAILRGQAEQLEAFFFAELLRASGTSGALSPSGRESEFESFLVQAHAEAVAESGQTGLAEAIFRSMSRTLGG